MFLFHAKNQEHNLYGKKVVSFDIWWQLFLSSKASSYGCCSFFFCVLFLIQSLLLKKKHSECCCVCSSHSIILFVCSLTHYCLFCQVFHHHRVWRKEKYMKAMLLVRIYVRAYAKDRRRKKTENNECRKVEG